MNDRELKSLVHSIETLRNITDGLWRRSLENKAWIVALYRPLIELLAKQTGKTEKQIKTDFRNRQRAAYQKLMEKIEKKDAALAAQLDNRDIQDVR